MSSPLDHCDFEALDVVKYSDIILLSLNSEEVENCLMKNGLLGNFEGICFVCCEGQVKFTYRGTEASNKSEPSKRQLLTLMIPTSNKVRDLYFYAIL